MPDLSKYLALVPSLKERFEGAPLRYGTVAAAVRPQITHYEWTDGARYALDPLHFELGAGGPPGKLLKSAPKKKRSGAFRYGFSPAGQVLVEEQYTQFDGQIYEGFWEIAADGPSATLYDYTPQKRCINVQQLFLVEGVPVAFIRYALIGVMVSVFEYEGSRLVRVGQQNRMHDSSMHPSYTFRRDLTVRYENNRVWEVDATYDDGRIERVLERGELL